MEYDPEANIPATRDSKSASRPDGRQEGQQSPGLGHRIESEIPFNDGINILRGVAIFAVILYHLGISGFSYGYLGVDVFFVISGFLMATLYSEIRGIYDIKRFYLSRIRRIAPAYYVVIIIISIAAAIQILPFEFDYVRTSAFLCSLFLGNFDVWMKSGYFARHIFQPEIHLWSLGVEAQFYIVFPAIAVMLRKRRSLIILLILLSFAGYAVASILSPKTAFLMMPLRLWQFAFGYLAATIPIRNSRNLFAAAAVAIGFVMVLAQSLHLGPFATTLTVTALASIAVAASAGMSAPRAIPGRQFSILGKYSYSLYLTHYPIIAFATYVPFQGGMGRLERPLEYCIVLAAIGIASFLLFHLVEMPARQRVKSLSKAIFLLPFGAASAGIAVTTAPVFGQHHFSGRADLAANAWLDRLPERCPKLGRMLHPFDRSCRISGDGNHPALLLGDSHADVLKKILGEEIKRRGGSLRLLINHSGVYFPSGRRLAREADRNKVDAFAIERLSPDDVIAEARIWKAEKIIFHARADHTDVEALVDLARLARRNSMTLYVILPVPNPDFDVPERLFRLASLGGRPESVMPTVHNHLSGADIARLRQAAGAYPSLQILDPSPYLCQRQCAIANSNGIPYYSDSQHLTQTGVEKLRPLLASIGDVPAKLQRIEAAAPAQSGVNRQ